MPNQRKTENLENISNAYDKDLWSKIIKDQW